MYMCCYRRECNAGREEFRDRLSPVGDVSAMGFPVKARAGSVEGKRCLSPLARFANELDARTVVSPLSSPTTRPGRSLALLLRSPRQERSAGSSPVPLARYVQSCWIERPYIFPQSLLLDICSCPHGTHPPVLIASLPLKPRLDSLEATLFGSTHLRPRLGFTKCAIRLTLGRHTPTRLILTTLLFAANCVRGMATEVHSIPAPPTLLERRSGSRLQLLSDNHAPHPTDARTQSKDEVTRSVRGNLTSPLTFTPLTPILASPVLTPANTTASPPNPSTNLNSASLPSTLTPNSGGVQHKRSRSTLSRLHVTLPEDYFDTQNHVRSATIPGPSPGPGNLFSPSSSPPLSDIIILNGIPIAKTPPLTEDTTPRDVDFSTVFPQVSIVPRLSRSRSKSARKSFTIGSDDEDDTFGQQQKREAAAKAKKLERYDDLRRYHALMELLKTEAKYLQDLRILINVCATRSQLGVNTNSSAQVYLQQLPYAVTSRSVASYFGTSASSSKQTPSPSPSTFSSTHTQGQSTTAPPSPIHSPPTTPRRSIGPNDRFEIDKDLPFTCPIFTEEDIRLLCRNSSEILTFHERFVDDLKEALTPLGSKFRFDTEDEYAYVDMPRHDTLELAIQIIVSMFVDRVSFRFPVVLTVSSFSSFLSVFIMKLRHAVG